MSGPPDESPASANTSPRDWTYLFRLWFGVSEPVHQKAYFCSGFGLMLLKYGVEALLTWVFTGQYFSVLDFLNPTMDGRSAILHGGPDWLPWVLFLWTLPFLWIAISMSVRRMINCGSSPWLGMLVLVPVVNLIYMLASCFVPSAAALQSVPAGQSPSRTARPGDAAMAIGLSILVGGLMLWISVYVFATYGASLFLGTPMLMSATASYLYNRMYPRPYSASIGVGLSSVFFALCALLLFALEGGICVAMAAPLVLPIGALGGLLGKMIADATRRPPVELLGALLVLPLWAVAESWWMSSPERVVLTSENIAAPPSVVWNNVVDFPELTEAKPWYFSWGIACPMRARIVGCGVGATRYCEFTTGAFVEPITAWDEPRRLAFDVSEQPDPLIELSPYRNIRPPHLNHYLRSTHGEFRLIALADGSTQLEGRTWYRFDMYPQWYWSLWSDLFIHRIHERVLEHIKQLSETSQVASR